MYICVDVNTYLLYICTSHCVMDFVGFRFEFRYVSRCMMPTYYITYIRTYGSHKFLHWQICKVATQVKVHTYVHKYTMHIMR